MKQISCFLKQFLKEALPISLLPLVAFITCYSLEVIVGDLFSRQNLSSFVLVILSFVKEWSLQCYSSFWSFIITMCLLHLLIQSTQFTLSIWSKEAVQNQKQIISKRSFFGSLISLVLSYTIIFGVYKSATFLFPENHIHIQSPVIQADTFSLSDITLPRRLLTQQKTSNFGEILSSIDRPVSSLVFSPKKNILYVSFLDNSLGIYDVSNLSKLKSLESVMSSAGEVLLSQDEMTALVYNGQKLDIFIYEDISKSTALFYNVIEVNRNTAKNDYRPLRMSSDKALLFFGGNTFQIYDVADYRNPQSLYKSEDCTDNPITSIALSKDDKTVFLTYLNSSLQIFDINSPKRPVKLSQLQIDGVPTSIDLFQKTNQLVLTSYQIYERELRHDLFVQRIDVNDLKNPKLISKNFTSFCKDEGERYILDDWTRCVNSKVKVYNEDDEQIMFYDESSFQLITFGSKNPIILMPDDIDSPKSIAFWPGSNIAFIGASRLLVVKLGLEVIPNKQLPLQANILSQTYLNEIDPHITRVTSDSKIAFMVGKQLGNGKGEKYRLGICDISNNKSPKYLQSLKLSDEPTTLTLSPDEKSLYVGVGNSLRIINVTNLLTPKIVRTLSFNDSVVAFTLSLDGKLAYIMLKGKEEDNNGLTSKSLAIVNLANMTNSFQQNKDFFLIRLLGTPPRICFSLDDSLILSEDGKTLLFLDQDLLIFKLQSWQDLLDRVPRPPFSTKTITLSNVRCPSIRFAPNSSEILYVLSVVKAPNFQILKVLNISSSETLASIPLTYQGRDFFCSNSLLLLPKKNMLAVTVPKSLMLFDISKPSTLALIGDFKIEFDGGIWKSLIPLDDVGSTIFYPSNSRGLRFFSLDQQYALSTLSKSLKLGERYSEEIQVLSQNPHATYNPLSSPYQFNALSLCNYKTSPLLQYPEIRFSQLPSWMYFDKDNGILVSEPRTESDIQSYRICSIISKKFSTEDFDGVSDFASPSLLSYLISVGYIGIDYFLTPSFDPDQQLALNEKFNSTVQGSIRDVLSSKYILTGFQLNVESSLYVQLKNWPIQIKTPSRNPVNIIIQLDSFMGNANFVNKAYPNVLESITHNKTQITLDGSLLYINYALEQLLVNLEDGFDSCQGSITVTDRLNPTINKTISTEFFKKYSSPLLNPNPSFSLQNQISNVRAYAGQYNLIPLDHHAFKPQHEEELTYQLIMQDGSQVPEWISLRDLNLIVSSPEKSLFLKVELAIIAKNEFKSVTDRFTLTIYPSFSSLFKTLAAYCGTLISLIGLRLYYPRIYNIFCKKRYRHSQDFRLGPGDNISVTGPYPIAFIAEEISESKILLKLLKDFVAGELNQRSISMKNLVQHFIDPTTKELDQSKIIQTIERIPLSKDQNNKLTNFTDHIGLKKKMIYQIIINQLITEQLKNDVTTNKLFNKLKDSAFDLVEWQTDGSFIINHQKLQQQMISTESNNESIETGLLIDTESSNFNFNLLKEALWVHVFNLSNIDAPVGAVSIRSKRQVEYRSLYGCYKRFFKKDLPPVLSANGKRIGYGLKHKIENGVLRFYGVVEDEIRGKTLVIQIANGREMILKEIWIYGEADKMSSENQVLDKTNDIL